MLKIATHDSITGEKGKGLLSFLVSPFAKTQRKTIKEQLDSGVRYFDLRTRKTKKGWIGAHGLWTCKKSFEEILEELNNYNDIVYANITYEGWGDEKELMNQVDAWMKKYPNIIIGMVSIKYTNGFNWKTIKVFNNIPAVDGFTKIDHFCIELLIPIPWLWKKIKGPYPEFNEEYFIFVDFY